MTPEQFFDLFLKELEEQEEMQSYHRFLGKRSWFDFRRNFYLERLRYLARYVNDPSMEVWDCGSGYGTTGFFLAMNGIRTRGTTLEYYFDVAAKRYEYWSRFGDASLFSSSYENLFDSPPPAETFDAIIVQDTLHHLEPIEDALGIFHRALKPGGKIVAIDENGSNLIQRAKLYKLRGNKRIIRVWDDRLQKHILIGNENIRSLSSWQALMNASQFDVVTDSVQYLRYYLPYFYRDQDAESVLSKERELQRRSRLRREYLFFGLNFVGLRR